LMRHTRPILGGFFARNGKVWPNDRPGLGVTVDERQHAFVEAVTEGAPGASQKRLDGSLTHW
jgi:L-alanine-DL-glutamate epimerase-like enolase superfamily enzyme